MPPHYAHQKTHNYFAYTGPEPKCDCDLLQTEYCCQHTDLVHTRLVDEVLLDLSLDEGRQHASYRIEIRQCPICLQLWWMHLHGATHYTHERDSEVVIGSVDVTFSSAVRCPDRAAADELTEWFPRHLEALTRCARIDRTNANNLIGAVRVCLEIAALNPRTLMLTDSCTVPRESSRTRQRYDARMKAYIERLEEVPDDHAAWQELHKLQRWCHGERLLDPAVKPENWTTEELWTPALAGVRQLEFSIWAARNAAQKKALGSPEHQELRRIEDGIAARWSEYMRTMEWPSVEVEFHCLLEHAKTLYPEVVAGDKASWEHPRLVCMRLYRLISRLGVKPSWRVDAPDWIAERTGLPDGKKRTHENACRSALLDLRRRERQRVGTA